MRKLSRLAGLTVEYISLPLLPFFKKISCLSGNICGKNIEIYNSRSFGIKTRVVAKINLKNINDINFTASKKKLGYNFLRALGVPMISSGNGALDKKIVFQTNDKNFMDMVFKYEEIRDKFSDIWSQKLHDGVISVGQASIFYHEATGIFTEKKRKRFMIAINLLGDLFDVLSFYKRKPHD